MGTPAQTPAPAVAAATAAGPAEPVPVAVLARTSTLDLQDPLRLAAPADPLLPGMAPRRLVHRRVLLGRRIRRPSTWSSAARATPGGPSPPPASPATEAWPTCSPKPKPPLPRFAAVVCEDIERSGRDTFNALKLEKELSRARHPALRHRRARLHRRHQRHHRTGPPGQARRRGMVPPPAQGEDAGKGSRSTPWTGGTSAPPPTGTSPSGSPHPARPKPPRAGPKAASSSTRPAAPSSTQIFHWRADDKLVHPHHHRPGSTPTRPPTRPRTAPGWTETTVDRASCATPSTPGTWSTAAPAPPPASKRPARPARPVDLVTRARPPRPHRPGHLGRRPDRRRPNAATPATPRCPPPSPAAATSCGPAIRCRACQRRMCGIAKPNRQRPPTYIYYRCPHDPANPRHPAAHPDHPAVSVREDTLMAALAAFFDQYVFGHDRAALLAAQLPATAADHADQQARHQAHLRTELARIDTAERALITELEDPADPADPAAQAYRARIRARYAELYAQRTHTETQLAALRGRRPPGQRPRPARRTAHLPPRPGRRPRPDQGSPHRRVRHPGPLQQGQEPGHHLGQPHRQPPPPPSPPCSPTPAPTTTPSPAPRPTPPPAPMRGHSWYPPRTALNNR